MVVRSWRNPTNFLWAGWDIMPAFWLLPLFSIYLLNYSRFAAEHCTALVYRYAKSLRNPSSSFVLELYVTTCWTGWCRSSCKICQGPCRETKGSKARYPIRAPWYSCLDPSLSKFLFRLWRSDMDDVSDTHLFHWIRKRCYLFKIQVHTFASNLKWKLESSLSEASQKSGYHVIYIRTFAIVLRIYLRDKLRELLMTVLNIWPGFTYRSNLPFQISSDFQINLQTAMNCKYSKRLVYRVLLVSWSYIQKEKGMVE